MGPAERISAAREQRLLEELEKVSAAGCWQARFLLSLRHYSDALFGLSSIS
jgi:hypothetical protein